MYQLRGRLGRWGFGEIYEAVHTDSGEVRMLKLVRGRRATDPQVRQHLAREFELASRVDHPNIMTVRGFERTPGLGIHLVLERMEGDTLAEMLKRGVTFLPPVAADVCSGVMAGLSACHAAGFGHFELSSETVFLQKTGLSASHPLITGFGFPPPQDSADEAATLPLEALPYAAPERRTGKRWDLRADIYSACAILMQLLTRQAPPPHGWQTPPSLPDPKTELAQKLHNVAARGLEPDPGQRPQQMHELLAQVRALIAAPPAAAPPAAEPSGRSETPDRAQAVFSTHEYAASRQRTGRPRRQQAARKTVLGLGAVGNRRSGGPQRAPQPKKTPLATTHPGLQAPPRPQGEDSSRAVGTTGLAAAGQADEKANNRQEPPPIPPSPPAAAAPLQDSVQDDAPPAEKLALVGSEAAREEVGQEPLEPGFFPGSQTGPMLAVDPSEVVETELPAPVLQKPKKSWLKWVIGVVLVGVLGTAVALVVVFEPWRDLQGETRPSTGAKGKEPKTRKARTQPRTADGAAKQKSDGSVAETGGGTDAGVSAADAQGDAKTMDAQVDAQVGRRWRKTTGSARPGKQSGQPVYFVSATGTPRHASWTLQVGPPTVHQSVADPIAQLSCPPVHGGSALSCARVLGRRTLV
jgi:serine/threonine-protein kinase